MNIIHMSREAIELLNGFLLRNECTKSSIALDHLGYKCGSTEEYESIKLLLMPSRIDPIAEWVHETHVSGRRITFAKLRPEYAPSAYLQKILYLEIQDQKPDQSQKSGFDHVEIVPKGSRSLDEFAELLSMAGWNVKKNDKSHHPTTDVIRKTLDGKLFAIKLSRELLVHKIIREMKK